MTIRTKLTLLYSGLLAVIIIVFGVLVFGVIRSAWIGTVDSALDETASQVILNSRIGLVGDFSGPRPRVFQLPEVDVFRASGTFVQIWLLDRGRMIFGASSANIADYTSPLDGRAMDSSSVEQYRSRFVGDTELRVLTRPMLTLSGQQIGVVQVGASLATVNSAIEKLSLVMIIASGVALVGSFALGMYLSHQALKPIDAIIQAADSISTARDLKTRLPWNGPRDELGRLTAVFNRMMDRLEHLFGVQQRFVADVSHELRTPLTTICGNLEMIQRYGIDSASMEAIESEAERMSRMVNDLLLLARADYGGLTLDLAPIDLDTVVTDVFKQASVLARDRDLEIRLTQLEPVRMMGNADRMKQLALNLVNNAIKFTPDGGKIALRLAREGDQGVFQVRDTGVGIAPEDMTRIFDRFYQADPSRSRVALGEGNGLGLSIAQWIAEAHGGSIQVESAPGEGATFTVRMPLTTDETAAPTNAARGAALRSWQRLSLPRRKRSAEGVAEHR